VHYHVPGRRVLQDVLTCIREGCTIDNAGYRLFANAERHLKSPEEMARLFARWPEALARTVEIAERCRFSLDELRYEYPDELTTGGRTPQQELEMLARIGAKWRYPGGVPDKVEKALAHELALIAQLDYASYFLTVYDLVRFAREREILCQGRGSAANSTVCYCLGVTSVDPAVNDLLFERFLSAERCEPPDIDVDFEHERREEVIQHVYDKYGRDRAGIAATVICYRSRSALREVGKAMGLSLDLVGALSSQVWAPTYGKGKSFLDEARLREHGLDPNDPRLAMTLRLARELKGFPRHLSQHVGGFVISRGLLSELVPIENAAMEDRTFIEWDKDDVDAMRMMKVDVLALGMLTCIRKCFDMIAQHKGRRYQLADIKSEDDGEVYQMLQKGESLGVFQVESRAQMNMLPRHNPRKFY
jgi:error-prone DNA polymerase